MARSTSSLDSLESHKSLHHRDTSTTSAVFLARAPIGSSLLVLFTLWAPRCPCCPQVMRTLDFIVERLCSDEYRFKFPLCPLFAAKDPPTLRHVVCDVDRNDLADSEWPLPSEGIQTLPGASDSSNAAGFMSLSPQPSEEGQNNSSAGDPQRSLPTIMAYRDGKRLGHFKGIRTARNLCLFVLRAFALVPCDVLKRIGMCCSSSRLVSPTVTPSQRISPPVSFEQPNRISSRSVGGGGGLLLSSSVTPPVRIGDDDQDDFAWVHCLLTEVEMLEMDEDMGQMRKRDRI